MSSVVNAVLTSLSKSSYVTLLEHAICVFSVLYFLNKLRKVRLSSVLKAVGASGVIDREIDQKTNEAVRDLMPKGMDPKCTTQLPDKGVKPDALIAQLKEWKQFDADGRGRAFAYVYDSDHKGAQDAAATAAHMYIHSNALSPIAFPSLRKMEVECVAMSCRLLNGDAKTCGTLTSGGTESVLCAVKAYRDRARDLWPHITQPEMVLPVSAHAAFPKAAHLFDVKLVYVDLDDDMRPNLAAYRKAITKNTILLVASAPQYPHGVLDPISEISAMAVERKLPLHVDACIGGFLLPWIEQLGYPVPPWDFRVPGVTSISADLHKFGYTHKGASILAFRHFNDRKYQFFAFVDWPGGLFVSPSLLGTRSGGAIAAAWVTMMALGKEGYLRLSKDAMDAAKKFQAGINKIPGLQVLGTPVMSITSFRSTDAKLNIHVVADVMEKKHWKLERQHKPACVHLTVMAAHIRTVDSFLVDLAASVEYARAHPELSGEGSAAMYGSVAKIPDGTLLESFLVSFMGKVYLAPPESSSSSSSSSSSKDNKKD